MSIANNEWRAGDVFSKVKYRTRDPYIIPCFSNVQGICLLDTRLLLSGDVELNPGPQNNTCLKFFHWNFNSICARGSVKIPLIEAYDSLYKYDIIAISESMLDSSDINEEICIEGYSKEMYRSGYPSNTFVLHFRGLGECACISERV